MLFSRNGHPSLLKWSALVAMSTAVPQLTATVCVAVFGRGLNPYWFYGPAFVVTLVALLFVLRAMIRWSRLVRQHDGRLCIRCMYPLGSLDSPGTCPECGEPYPIDAHRSAWHRILPLRTSSETTAHSPEGRSAAESSESHQGRQETGNGPR